MQNMKITSFYSNTVLPFAILNQSVLDFFNIVDSQLIITLLYDPVTFVITGSEII